MEPDERRRDSFLDHLSDSEKRLGASRHSVFDALFVSVIVIVIAGGAVLGILRWRATSPGFGPSSGAGTATPVSTPVSTPAAPQTGSGDQPSAPPAPAASQTRKEQAPIATPAPGQARDARPYIDASKPGKYSIKDSKVEVEINTLSGKERDEKLEQLKKEGLLTDKEAEALKAQKR